MKIDEKKPGGGSGGDLPSLPAPPDPAASHADEKLVQGSFGRAAFGKTTLSTLPDAQDFSCTAVLAHGDAAMDDHRRAA